jgi:hypothetical protein
MDDSPKASAIAYSSTGSEKICPRFGDTGPSSQIAEIMIPTCQVNIYP